MDYEKQAEERVNEFKKQLKTATPPLNRPHYQAVKCAIISINRDIELLERIRKESFNGEILLDELHDLQKIKQELLKM